MLIAPENASTSPGLPPEDDLHQSTTSSAALSFSSALVQKSFDTPKLALKLSFSAACSYVKKQLRCFALTLRAYISRSPQTSVMLLSSRHLIVYSELHFLDQMINDVGAQSR